MKIRPATLVDASIAAAFVTAGQLVAWRVIQDSNTAPHGSRLAQSAFYLCFDALVFFWRRAPVPALLAMGPIGIVQTWVGGTTSFFAGFLAVIFVLFGAAGRLRIRETAACAAYVLLVLVAIIGVADDLEYATELPFSTVIILIAVSLGTTMQRRSSQARTAIARADELEAERERVLEEERARIARELHDVIAHSVSVMIVQAGAARLTLNGEAHRATESLLSVERAGRQALDEMRRLLGMLRQGNVEPQLTPQPGLGDLQQLVDQVRAAGLPVELEVEGTPVPLAPGVDLSAYRIAQEALTNTIKHAQARSARLRLRYEADAVAIEVTDDGRGGAVSGTGHGLVGMRERVELYRGTFEAGAHGEGGFRVHARLPVGHA
ncbi:MAG TPA: histidine kinase [Gaiellaceae bacterium]|jgi:signal transduction histidine kinase|nr:histidine kinase [Gaiellaceae bacterium]